MNHRSGALAVFLATILAFSSLAFPPSSEALGVQSTSHLSLAAMNPAFLQYLKSPSERGASLPLDGLASKVVPSPIDRSHLKSEVTSLFRSFPSSYDLRTTGKLTPVKNQSPYGTCWSFATYGSLESSLLPGENWNFSEDNMVNGHGFYSDPEGPYNHGGNYDMSTAYLVRWSGPINESDDPYPTPGLPSGLLVQKHVQEVLSYPGRSSPLSNDAIKSAVMTYGAVGTYMMWDSSYYNSTYYAYFYSGGAISNHAVTIVGWDDNFPASRFNGTPPGNGAYIVRNSWGTSWGEGGYFYVSYYDTWLGEEITIFNNAESTSNYHAIYQYDPLGWTASFGYNSNTAWFANIFRAQSNESLAAIGFYTARPNSNFELFVYDSFNGSSFAGLRGSKSGTISSPGYHTVPLDSPISFSGGDDFCVVVRLTIPGYNYPIAVEYPFSHYSDQAIAHRGESYVSSNGASWEDLTDSYANTNVCLKAFTKGGSPPSPTITVISPNGGESWTEGESRTIQWNSSGVSGNIRVRLNRNYPEGSWETLFSTTANDGSQAWTVSGQPSGRCRIKVSSVSNPSVFDISDENFTINRGHAVNITNGPFASPSTISSGGTTNLSVNAVDSQGHAISYNWSVLSSFIGDGSFSNANAQNPSWTAPPNTTESAQVVVLKVRASCTSDGSKFVEGMVNVTVESIAGTITVISPNGGESWTEGESRTIQWNSSGVSGDVRIELSRDGGSGWETLFSSTANDGSQPWTVSGAESSNCRVRISSLNDSSISDISDGNFTIRHALSGFTFNLTQGWNMISLPLVTDTNPSVVFAGISGTWYLYQWDPLSQSYRGKDQISLQPGVGLWLRVQSSQTITVQGIPYSAGEMRLNLSRGWNLVGYPYLTSMNWGDVRIGVGANEYTLDQASSLGIISPYLYTWSGTDYSNVRDLGKFEGGKGYWVRTLENCILIFRQGDLPPPPPG